MSYKVVSRLCDVGEDEDAMNDLIFDQIVVQNGDSAQYCTVRNRTAFLNRKQSEESFVDFMVALIGINLQFQGRCK